MQTCMPALPPSSGADPAAADKVKADDTTGATSGEANGQWSMLAAVAAVTAVAWLLA